MISECGNAEMRDRLPDVLHDRLPAAQRAELQAHLNACAECRAELALLERVRSAAGAVRIDTARIVASLPAFRRSPWRLSRSSILRIAAVIVLAVGGSMLLPDDTVPGTTQPAVTPAPIATVPVTTGATSQVATRSPQAKPAELAIGEAFEDLSDSELQALLSALESFEAKTSVETEVVVPAVSRGGA